MNNDPSEFIEKAFEDAKQDNSLLETLNIDEIIKMTESEHMDYLNEKTMNDILNKIQEGLNELIIDEKTHIRFFEKLAGYRYIENVYEIHKGKHIRWIRHNNPTKITNGAIVAEIKFCDSGTQVLCKTIQNRIFQIKYDECVIFQKLSTGEQLVLMAYEYANKQD
jgi:hypothetical protein